MTSPASSPAGPSHAVTDDARALIVFWPDGSQARLPAAALRRAARDAHSLRARALGLETPPPADLAEVAAEPVGAAGLNVRFSDGCDRAIFPWAYLREIAGELSTS